MKRQIGLLGGSTIVASAAAIGFVAMIAATPRPASADDCPGDGTVRFGVEPYDTAARLVPIYEKIGKLISDKVACKVEVFVATGYNAEIEAMRNGKLELAEFGPLGYVLAHQVAKAEAVAAFGAVDGKPVTYWASIVTYPSSGIKTTEDIRGHSFAFSDAASTSGHLFPAYGLRKAGLDPDKDIKAIYAGSHTASFEAIYNHKVDAGELNSEQLESATQRGHYKDGDMVFLWKSDPIPTDPFAVRGDLPDAFKKRLTEALQHIDLMSLDPADRKILVGAGITQIVPQTDKPYDLIRDLVKTLNIDLEKLSLSLRGYRPMLRIHGLSLRYPNGKLALTDFELEVQPGELVVVLGGNGSGKSTLLRCITRTLKPSSGEVWLGETNLCPLEGEKLRLARLELAMIWQQVSLVRRSSVLTNVASGALGRYSTFRTMFRGLPPCELDAARGYLADVGLAAVAGQRAGTLSGGQAQRVAIARALAQRPRVLLADEPVASLDPEASEEIMRLLQRLARTERLAVLCVLHQIELAFCYADRVIGIRDGRTAFNLPRSEVSRDAVHRLYLSEAA